jgi:hypothetical protein
MATQIDEYLIPAAEMITMDPAAKAEWVADLRSGKYNQAMGVLCEKDDKGFCCLGVLSEQAVRKGVAEKIEGIDATSYRMEGDKFKATSSLSDGLARWAGITYQDGFDEDKVAVSAYGRLPFKERDGNLAYLDSLNDDGMPFSQIADIIDFWY